MRKISLILLACLATVFAFKPMTNDKNFKTEYGICNLSTIPVRAEHSHKSEIVTQLLFGEAYTVTAISDDGEWKKIKAEYDGYEGWIADFQFKQVSEEYFHDYKKSSANHAVNNDGLAQVSHPQLGRQFISIGSVLPFYNKGKFKIGDEHFELENPEATRSNDLLKTAQEYMHTPYLWGGKSIFGIDCSGFVQQVFKSAHDLKLPRDAYQQADHGQLIHFDETQEGDLAFFENESGRITHVGILTGDGHIIHASGRVKLDHFMEEGIISKDTGKLTHNLSFIKRVSIESEVD